MSLETWLSIAGVLVTRELIVVWQRTNDQLLNTLLPWDPSQRIIKDCKKFD